MKPTLCSKCRYDLSGLPGVGACPECGQRYWVARSQGITHGESAETRGTAVIRRVRTLSLIGLGTIVLGAGIVMQLTSSKTNAFITGLGVGGLLIVAGVMSYFTEKDD